MEPYMFRTLDDAEGLARFAHRNQFDKSGRPYIEHPKRVYEAVRNAGGSTNAQIAAWLHDVTEDTFITPTMLYDLGFPNEAVKIVELLDRNVSYRYYERMSKRIEDKESPIFPCEEEVINYPREVVYYRIISRHPEARLVKIKDVEDNSNPDRLALLDPTTRARLERKYTQAMNILRQGEA